MCMLNFPEREKIEITYNAKKFLIEQIKNNSDVEVPFEKIRLFDFSEIFYGPSHMIGEFVKEANLKFVINLDQYKNYIVEVPYSNQIFTYEHGFSGFSILNDSYSSKDYQVFRGSKWDKYSEK